MKKVSILFNPSSGGGASQKRKNTIQRMFHDAGIGFQFFESNSEDHLREMAKDQASQCDAMVGIGGDTTFSIIAQELIHLKKGGGNVPAMGMIGTGSANDIVRGLGMGKISSLIHSINQWSVGKMDVGEITSERKSHFFLGTVSTGMGITVNRYLEAWTGRHRILRRIKVIHPIISGMAGIRHSFKKQLIPETVHLDWEGGEGFFDFSLLAFLNIPYYAGGLELSPLGSPYSGKLECCIVQTKSLFSSMVTGIRVILGMAENHSTIKRISSPYYKLAFSGEVDLQYDGEPITCIRDLKISILPKYLEVFFPTDS